MPDESHFSVPAFTPESASQSNVALSHAPVRTSQISSLETAPSFAHVRENCSPFASVATHAFESAFVAQTARSPAGTHVPVRQLVVLSVVQL